MPESKGEAPTHDVLVYKVQALSADLAVRQTELNALGADGWVLLQVVTAANTLGYFMRTVTPPPVT